MASNTATDTETNMPISAETTKQDLAFDQDSNPIVKHHSDKSIDKSASATDETAIEKPFGDGDGVTAPEKNETLIEQHSEDSESSSEDGIAEAPPLPNEAIPPLPSEAPPTATEEDDGWEPMWEATAQAFYFYNRFTGATQWSNPRVPDAVAPSLAAPPGLSVAPGLAVAPGLTAAPGTTASAAQPTAVTRPAGGYDPAVHGDYDPTAWYAQSSEPEVLERPLQQQQEDPAAAYAASAGFNRFTGRFQNSELAPENFNDENKSRRQMNAFFDVDAAANSHDGRSLKEERSGKKLTKTELKKFKEKRKAKKEEKRKAWLRD